MDLSALSNDDLLALKAGDLSKVSTTGLKALHQQAFDERAASDKAKFRAEVDPTNDMGTGARLLAGVGQGMTNTARGVGQLLGKALPDSVDRAVGLPTQADIDEAKRVDAPLMRTTAGRWGSAGGSLTAALPVALVPGVNGYAGAAGVGALTGLAQPVASDEGDFARLKNTAIGAAAGPAGVAAARGVGALYQTGKALVQPFTQSGQQQIAGRTLARFADDPNSIATASSKPTITGARPTLAEQTADPGIARLQDSLASLDPQISNAIGNRLAENNAARVASLNKLAGADGARDFAVAERAGTTQPMYEDAFKVIPDAASLTPEQARAMGQLMKAPAVQAAMRDAQAIAKNKGTNVGPSNASGSIEGMHNMKLSLDDQIAKATAAGETNKAASIRAARDQLTGLIESMSPEYATARQVYAQMSQPINSMDIAAKVAQKGLSNGTNLATGAPTINRNALLATLGNEPALIKQATGRNLTGKLTDVMQPDDLNMLRAIASEADRTGAVAAAGNGPGSATAQRMASQNILNNLMGPFGSLGDKAAQSTLVNTVLGKPVNLIYSHVAEPKIQQALAQAVLDPDNARKVLEAARNANVKLPPALASRLTQQAAGLATTENALTAAR